MNIPTSQSDIAHIQTFTGISHGVNTKHTCNVKTCSFKTFRSSLSSHITCICTKSLHYHICSTAKCNIGIHIKHGAIICPISGIETKPPTLVYYPARNKSWSAPHNSFAHNMSAPKRHTSKNNSATKRKHSIDKAKIKSIKLSTIALTTLINSSHMDNIKSQHSKKQISTLKQSIANLKSSSSFIHSMHTARTILPRTIKHHINQETITAIAKDIDDYITKIKKVSQKQCKGHNALVGACVSLLKTGLSAKGVTIFPKITCIAQNAPSHTQIGKIPGFQSRPMSVATRIIKSLVYLKSGTPNTNYTFKLNHYNAHTQL